jgi:two-component system LytT family response regulator
MTREWRVLVADDEPVARRGVRLLLSAHPEFVVVGDCRDGREVLDAIDRLAPDVIFLDIQMPELGGLDVIRLRTPERMPAVVFLTAYDRYALSAFDVEAVDYLVKPVAPARFARTMRRLTARLSTRAGAPSAEPSLTVSTPRGALVLPLHGIEWIEAADHYARVWSAGRAWLLREPLDQLEARVSPHGFMRVHRGAIVRVAAVRALVAGQGGGDIAELASGARVPVARRRKAALAVAVRGSSPPTGSSFR